MSDYDDINSALLENFESVLQEWLPGGRRKGKEFVAADKNGGKGKSLSVNLYTGLWCEFDADTPGNHAGDPVSLYAYISNLKQSDALAALAEKYGGSAGVDVNRITRPKTMIPVPASPPGAPPISSNGKHIALHCYREIDGSPIFYAERIRDGRGKRLLPWLWDGKYWHNRWPPAPRPLYGLETLVSGGRRVIVVEGEKTADAIRDICRGKYAVVSWPNGASAVARADWSPIFALPILIIPDADKGGLMAARRIADILAPECPEVRILDVRDEEDGWDVADHDWSGWAEFFKWAKSKKVIIHGEKKEVEISSLASIGFQCKADGKVALSEASIRGWLAHENGFGEDIWMDNFYERVFTGWKSDKTREWGDDDTRQLLNQMQTKFSLHMLTEEKLHKAVLGHAGMQKRNAPQDWIKSLEWDGKRRLETFFPAYCGSEDTEYTRSISKNFWISMMARIFKPGSKVDNMVILEGRQGAKKSSLLATIGGDWFGVIHANPSDKDFYQAMQGKILIEICELDSFNKAEVSTLKAVISNNVDRYRPSYGRMVKDYPRHCIFVGTTNKKAYLRDTTGNRRYWPIKCGDSINIDTVARDREQLFAEAYLMYQQGETWYEVSEQQVAEADMRRERDAWESKIATFLLGKKQVTEVEIATVCLGIDIVSVNALVIRRIEGCLESLGWDKCLQKTKRGGYDVVWVPARKQKDLADSF